MSYKVLPKTVSAQPTPSGDASVHCFVWPCSCHPAASLDRWLVRLSMRASPSMHCHPRPVLGPLPYITLPTLLIYCLLGASRLKKPLRRGCGRGVRARGPCGTCSAACTPGAEHLKDHTVYKRPSPHLLARPADWSCLSLPTLEARASPFPPHLPVWFDITAYFHTFALVGAIPLVWRTLLQFSTR